MTNVIGRKYEVSILNGALQSNKSELIAIFGRRRIGKTFLVRETYKNNICFEITGIYNVSLKDQLTNFNITLSKYQLTLKKVKNSVNWIEAFNRLGVYLDSIRKKNKKVVFIDEFPWFDTSKSNFLPAFENFWNSYASKRNDIVVVICGSAASYIVNKIIRNKGGLHNRITQKINLKAFNLSETEQMLTKQK
jgi:AAA+ ATPase superfamily predicted ATPase